MDNNTLKFLINRALESIRLEKLLNKLKTIEQGIKDLFNKDISRLESLICPNSKNVNYKNIENIINSKLEVKVDSKNHKNIEDLIESKAELRLNQILEKSSYFAQNYSNIISEKSLEINIPFAAEYKNIDEKHIRKIAISKRNQINNQQNLYRRLESNDDKGSYTQKSKQIKLDIDGRRVGEMVIDYVRGQNLGLPRGRGIFDGSIAGGI